MFDLNDWFLGRSYYCHLCEKVYNTDNFDHYPCIQHRCVDRKQKDCGDYKLHRLADRPVSRAAQLSCNTCPRTLYCHRCYDNHLVLAPNGHVTDSAKTSGRAYLYTCEECRKQINLWKSRRKRQRPNKFWEYFCKTFKDCVDIYIHKCFIKPVGEEESSSDVGLPIKRPGRSRTPRRASHAVGLLDRNVCPTVMVRRKIRRK